MPKFAVDVKAFIKVEVEAKNPAEARRVAEVFVDGLSPDPFYTKGWSDEGSKGHVYDGGCFDIDGESDVEELDEPQEICGQCLDPHCEGCVPFDTPSLDTSFHDHEMDV